MPIVEIPFTAQGLSQQVSGKAAQPGTPANLTNFVFNKLGELRVRNGMQHKIPASDASDIATHRCKGILDNEKQALICASPDDGEQAWDNAPVHVATSTETGWRDSPLPDTARCIPSNMRRLTAETVNWDSGSTWDTWHCSAAVGRIPGHPIVVGNVVTLGNAGSQSWSLTFRLEDGTQLGITLLDDAFTNARIVWDETNLRWLLFALPKSGVLNDYLQIYEFPAGELVPVEVPTPTATPLLTTYGPFDLVWPEDPNQTYYWLMCPLVNAGAIAGVRFALGRKSDATIRSYRQELSIVSSVAVSHDGLCYAWVVASTADVMFGVIPGAPGGSMAGGFAFAPVTVYGNGYRVALGVYNEASTSIQLLYDHLAQNPATDYSTGRVTGTWRLLSDGSADGDDYVSYGVELQGMPIVWQGTNWSSQYTPCSCSFRPYPDDNAGEYQTHNVLMQMACYDGERNRIALAANLQPWMRAHNSIYDTHSHDMASRGGKWRNKYFWPSLEWSTDGTIVESVVYFWESNGPETGSSCRAQSVDVLSGGMPLLCIPEGPPENQSDPLTIGQTPVTLQFPIISVADGSSVSGRTGTFVYKALYYETDSLGRKIRGPTSLQVTHTPTNVASIVSMPLCNVCASGKQLNYEIYRSDNGGEFHLASGTTDTELAGAYEAQEYLYTTSGEPSYFLPPWSNALATHNNRVFSSSGSRLWYSHELQPDKPPQWTAYSYIDCPDEILALASIGQQLLMFAENRIWVLAGDGPTRLMTPSFDLPRLVIEGVGASRKWGGHRSTFVVGAYVWFRSNRSIERMALGAEPEPIGEQIKDILADYPMVRSVTHVPSHQAIYWSLSTDDDTERLERTVVRYDYLHNSWSQLEGDWTQYAGALGANEKGLLAGVDCGAGDGPVGIWNERDDQYDVHSGTYHKYQAKLELSPIRPFGAGGRGWIRRMQLLGEYRGESVLNIDVSDDQAKDLFPSRILAIDYVTGAVRYSPAVDYDYDNAGVTWADGATLGTGVYWYAAVSVGDRVVAIESSTGDTKYSDDAGDSWTAGGSLGSGNWRAAAEVGGRIVAVHQTDGSTMISEDRGKTWNAGNPLGTPSGYWESLSTIYGRLVALDTLYGNVLASDDRGDTWESLGSGVGPGTWIALGVVRGRVLGVYYTPGVTKYSDNQGATWSVGGTVGTGNWTSVVGYGAQAFVSASNDSTLYYSDDLGENWAEGEDCGITYPYRLVVVGKQISADAAIVFDAYSVSTTLDETEAEPLEVQHRFHHPWTSSVKLTFTLSDNYGQFPFLNALSIEVDPVQGAKRVKTSKEL